MRSSHGDDACFATRQQSRVAGPSLRVVVQSDRLVVAHRDARNHANETLQLGIVVRDLEATMRGYVDDYGIGPCEG
jgi:hypothetical protein